MWKLNGMVSQAFLSQDVSHLPLPFASVLIILTNWFAVIYLEILLVASHSLIVRLHTCCLVVLPGLFAGSGLSRGSVPPAVMGHHPPWKFRDWCSWVNFRASPAEKVGWQVRADNGDCALDLQPVSAECQGRASFWFTLYHSPDKKCLEMSLPSRPLD